MYSSTAAISARIDFSPMLGRSPIIAWCAEPLMIGMSSPGNS
jgi:hypothetical protein